MNSAKRQPNGPAKITIPYSYTESRPRWWFLKRPRKKNNLKTVRDMFEVTTDLIKDWWIRPNYLNRRAITCREEYTSKTCSERGSLHSNLVGAKMFKCPQYSQKSHRDFNRSRNTLSKTRSLVFRLDVEFFLLLCSLEIVQTFD